MGQRIARMPGGVLIPSRLTWETLDATRSSYSESGAVPGTPEAVTPGAVYRVQVSGGQGEDLEVVSVRAGYPGSMAVAYRLPDQSETSDDDYRGWNPPVWWDAWAGLQLSSTVPWRRNDIVTLPNTQQVVVILRNGSTATVGARAVDSATLEAGAVGALISSTGTWEWPAACVVPDRYATGGGRILVLYGGRVYTSADAGSTWALHSKHPIREDTTNHGRCRMAHRDGQILLLVEDTSTANTVHQYLSTDGGSTFTLVSTIASVGNTVSVVATWRGFHVVYARGLQVYARRVSSAGQTLAGVVETSAWTASGLGVASDSVFAVADPDGGLWAYACQVPSLGSFSDGHFHGVMSSDGGDSWSDVDGFPIRDDQLLLRHLSATSAAGRILVAHSWQDGDAAVDAGLGLLALGGWSSWTTGPATGGPGWNYTDRMGSAGYSTSRSVLQIKGHTWIPAILPANADPAWSWTGTAPTLLTTGWAEIDTTAAVGGGERSTSDGGATAQLELVVDAGGSSGTTQVGVEIKVADGTDDYELEVCLTTSEIQVRDGHGGTALATVAVDTTTGLQLQVELTESGDATVGWRRRGATRWQLIVDGQALTSDTATPAAFGRIRWGHLALTTSTSRWRWVADQYHSSLHQPRLYHGTGNDGVYGRTMTGTPSPLPDAADAADMVPWLRATAGPARYREVLRLPAHHERGVHRVFPAVSPSPSTPWRSANTNEQVIAFDLDARSWLGNAVGMYVGRANFRTAALETSVNGSTWATAGTLDLATGFSNLAYQREGDTVYFDGSASAGRYLWEGELEGGTAILPTSSGTVLRRIAWNSAGSWAPGSVATPEIRLLNVDGSEDLSGTMTLFAPSGLLVVYPTASVRRRHWRIRIPAQDTAEGYLQAGIMFAGRVQPWGAEVDLTRSDTWSPNVQESRSSYGVTRLRERGPMVRSWRFGWNDGAWRGLIRGDVDLDFYGVSGGIELAAREDVAEQLAGIMREIRSGAIPVVVAEPLPDATSTITDPSRVLYGHLRGAVSANGMAGDPNSKHEFVRIEAMTLEEIP